MALKSVFVFAAPQIGVDKEYNLGELEEGKVYEKSFSVKNSGDGPLEVRAINPSCGCIKIIHPNREQEVFPGETLGVKFTFNTEGMSGEVIKYILIESNDPQNPSIRLKLEAQVERLAQKVNERFKSFGLWAVLFAGLIDGVNPCAFTVLVFFISFLNFTGDKRKELIVLGSTFIFSVFVTYIVIGLGLFKFIQSLEYFNILSKVIYRTVACLAVVLGFFSLYDLYIYRKTGNPEDTKLKLPEFIKNKIHKVIRDSAKNSKRALFELALAIFLCGAVVSLLESVCTGQTYLPTIVYVLNNPELRARAFLYLVLYNILFIAPLSVIFIAALTGTSSQSFSNLARKRLGLVKLLTAVLFLGLGILLFKIKGG